MTPEPGDIILFRVGAHPSLMGKLIDWGQKIINRDLHAIAYEHIVIVGWYGDIVEAYWPKVRSRIYSPVGTPNAEVYRVRGITQKQIAKGVLAYAYGHVGEWYNMTGLLTLGLIQLGHSVVCSQFVWKCFTGFDYMAVGYEAAGITLCPSESFITPDDIAASPLLVRVF